MIDDDTARRRLLIYTGVRLSGVVICLLGAAIIYSDLIRPGGWPQLGALVAIVGALHALLSPHFIKKKWDREKS
jgi:hypothetical protein